MKPLFVIALLLLGQSNPISKDELLGKVDPATHPDFVQIDDHYTTKSNIYLRKQAYDQFILMHTAAKAEGINLKIVSATRSFAHQKRIWEGKWQRPRYMGWSPMEKAEDIMTYSSMPGTSRHHWGTDIDLNSLDNSYFASGTGLDVYNWLHEHAIEYGFAQTYTSKEDGRTGYNEEKWHWSYMPLSEKYLDAYLQLVVAGDIDGFSGHQVADTLRVIPHYVNGIDPGLIPEH